MSKKKIKEFFDSRASQWDAEMIKIDSIVDTILNNCRIGQENNVLDVACGTGVLFDDYLSRNVAAVTGVDISPRMTAIASKKYKDAANIRVICGDIENETFDVSFDRIMVYNAFPHFLDSEKLIMTLAHDISKGGIISIAHSMSRDMINSHHSGLTDDLACDLMSAEELAELLAPYFKVDVIVSTDKMFQVCGVRK